jgi:hypothetical protein
MRWSSMLQLLSEGCFVISYDFLILQKGFVIHHSEIG